MQHHNGNAKLNPQKVREMLRLRAEGWSYPRLARAFGVSENTVAKTCKGTAWRSVTGGQEVLTDGEAELRALMPLTSPPELNTEEIAASMARVLKAQEEFNAAQNAKAEKPDALSEHMERMRTAPREESSLPTVKVRYPIRERDADDLSQHEVKEQAMQNAAQLLETLKDETHQDSKAPVTNDGDAGTHSAAGPAARAGED